MRSSFIVALTFVLSGFAVETRDRVPLSAVQSAVVESRLRVVVPDVDAELLVDDRPAVGTGIVREILLPSRQSGTVSEHELTASWRPNTYTIITRSTTLRVWAGETANVDLTSDDRSDRIRIRYVATPSHVVGEMIALAGVTENDVVFEPGCGDARLTIAAMKAGARTGVGIDIDADRVAESRKNVEAAGLDKTVEIRLGDALNISDLSRATVVFLYMGDEFNRRIRPFLWSQLPVGARVVSHRFAMGDWPADKTVSLPDEAGNIELHLWTITPAIKASIGRK